MAHLYSLTATKPSEVTLPEGFATETPKALVAQAFHVYRERAHTGLPQVLTRGEVSLTTKKMYKQKHTGNARHSSARAPIFVGGGVTHGPKGIKTTHYLSKKLKVHSRRGSIALKIAENAVHFIDLSGITKTKEAATVIKMTGAKTVLLALTPKNWALAKAFRNIDGVSILSWDQVNAYAVLMNQVLLVDSEVLSGIKVEKTAKKEKVVAVKPTKKVTAVKKAATKKKTA